MELYVYVSPICITALTKDKNIISTIPFKKDPEKIAKILFAEEPSDEERKLVEEFSKKGYEKFYSNIRSQGFILDPFNEVFEHARKKLRQIALEKLNLFKDELELNEFLTEVGRELTRLKLKASVGRDALVIQAVDAWEELNKTINVHVERLREWYGLYFPEMEREKKDHRKFVELVARFGFREKMPEAKLKELANSTVGMDLEEQDVLMMQNFARVIDNLFKMRDELETYIDETLKQVAPNLRAVAGPMLAAKLLALGGSLEKLAKMPSSTIQLLGAEKALFRFLRGKGKSPRHGVIFLHPLIQRAPDKFRGKIARLLAAKLTMAVRIDYYGGEFIGDKLKEELEEKVKKILKGEHGKGKKA